MILHIIIGLSDGGAEGVLYRICKYDDHDHLVISLTNRGKYGPLLEQLNVPVYNLNFSYNLFLFPYKFFKLWLMIKRFSPSTVQTWMPHADLLGGLAARLAGVRSIVWGIRHTSLDRSKSKMATIVIVKLLAKLSWWLPSRIAVCAKRAMDIHESLGYNRAIMKFIPNGYDLFDFIPRSKEARVLRLKWGFASNITLIGSVGRYDPQKDHANLLRALSFLRTRNITIRCVLIGTNLDNDNQELVKQIQHLELEESVMLLGRRMDIPAVMSALDVHVLPSAYGEAFPNVVAEAMACETPCVVTDVGDAAYIVENTGWVVPPCDAEALANAIEKALEERQKGQWLQRCISNRQRIQQHFSIDRMIYAYHKLWNESL